MCDDNKIKANNLQANSLQLKIEINFTEKRQIYVLRVAPVHGIYPQYKDLSFLSEIDFYFQP